MNEGQIIGRLDHSFGQKLSVFVRFLNDPYNSIGPEGIGGNTNPIPGLATTSAQSGAQNTLLHATYVPAPRWVIEGGLSHMRAYENTHVIGLLNPANAPDFNVNLPYVNLTGKLPTVTIDGTKYNSAGPINRINPTNQAFLNVTHTMGKHTLLFGVNVERMKSSYTNLNNGNNGGFNFTAPSSVGNTQAVWNQSFADFLIGYTTSFSQSTFGAGEGYGADSYEAYVQDNYKPTENLTLNVGLRYSYYKDPTEWILNSDNFDPSLYSAAQAPTIDNTGYICLKAPCAGGGTPNAAYNPLNGIIIPGENSPFGRAMVFWGGYELSGIVNLSAGGVLTGTTSNQDPAGLGLLTSSTAATARPDRVGDPNNGPRTTKEWFDTSAFAFVPASQTRPGNESIGTIYGPGSEIVNIALMRNIRRVEKLTLQLRVETYNTLNHTNLSNPNTSLNSSNFGVISNNGEPRKMQIAAKLRF